MEKQSTNSATTIATFPHDHAVQFYDKESYLLESVKNFIEAGDVAIVIATAEHGKLLERDLRINGVPVEQARNEGKYFSFDAEETLAQFMVGVLPNAKKFNKIMNGVLHEAQKAAAMPDPLSSSDKKLDIRAFGEMVAVLWERGNSRGAIRLEELWNKLQETNDFSLFCAYPMRLFANKSQLSGFINICKTHGGITPSEGYMQLPGEKKKFREIAILQQKARALDGEIRKSKMLERQREAFLAAASHELKTPITSIHAYSRVLQNEFASREDKTAQELLKKMDDQIGKLVKVINDLLDISKARTGTLTFDDAPFEANELIREIVEEMQSTTVRHTISMQLCESVQVHSDRYRIGQVLANLLSNAIKYSPNSDTITVSSEATEGKLTIHVKDSGLGISPKDQKRIFKEFLRGEDDRLETFSGMGLGLPIAREIIERQRGNLWVESIPDKGSCFSFSLPIYG